MTHLRLAEEEAFVGGWEMSTDGICVFRAVSPLFKGRVVLTASEAGESVCIGHHRTAWFRGCACLPAISDSEGLSRGSCKCRNRTGKVSVLNSLRSTIMGLSARASTSL